jgi:hypothetical protein
VPLLHELKSLAALPGEYRRARAASRRYDELKFRGASIARRQDITRQVFEELYASSDGGNSVAANPAKNGSERVGPRANHAATATLLL